MTSLGLIRAPHAVQPTTPACPDHRMHVEADTPYEALRHP